MFIKISSESLNDVKLYTLVSTIVFYDLKYFIFIKYSRVF